MMPKHFYKHKLLLDENFYYPATFPILNRTFDVKHIVEDFKQVGLKDPKVYKYAIKVNRILVTFNYLDFYDLAEKDKSIGVLGISNNLLPEVIDKKLTALLKKSSRKSLLGKITILTGETIVSRLKR